ncbi:hypothetical protein [Amycolatopsis benzoatilytica]|uniref:hypothetical protein n=1 Tax=Amycolatopsis benzoatilytica TaxID=346045 RepID=UPI00037EFD39|nr:hypothetical protein [Amycolatopsis benzoatilytica]
MTRRDETGVARGCPDTGGVHVEHAQLTVAPAQLPRILLTTAVGRPVFLRGAPGIRKPSPVRDFATAPSLDCVSLPGAQRAPDDLIGVPRPPDRLAGRAKVRGRDGTRLPFVPRGPVFRAA